MGARLFEDPPDLLALFLAGLAGDVAGPAGKPHDRSGVDDVEVGFEKRITVVIVLETQVDPQGVEPLDRARAKTPGDLDAGLAVDRETDLLKRVDQGVADGRTAAGIQVSGPAELADRHRRNPARVEQVALDFHELCLQLGPELIGAEPARRTEVPRHDDKQGQTDEMSLGHGHLDFRFAGCLHQTSKSTSRIAPWYRPACQDNGQGRQFYLKSQYWSGRSLIQREMVLIVTREEETDDPIVLLGDSNATFALNRGIP